MTSKLNAAASTAAAGGSLVAADAATAADATPLVSTVSASTAAVEAVGSSVGLRAELAETTAALFVACSLIASCGAAWMAPPTAMA